MSVSVQFALPITSVILACKASLLITQEFVSVQLELLYIIAFVWPAMLTTVKLAKQQMFAVNVYPIIP